MRSFLPARCYEHSLPRSTAVPRERAPSAPAPAPSPGAESSRHCESPAEAERGLAGHKGHGRAARFRPYPACLKGQGRRWQGGGSGNRRRWHAPTPWSVPGIAGGSCARQRTRSGWGVTCRPSQNESPCLTVRGRGKNLLTFEVSAPLCIK